MICGPSPSAERHSQQSGHYDLNDGQTCSPLPSGMNARPDNLCVVFSYGTANPHLSQITFAAHFASKVPTVLVVQSHVDPEI
jgi:hypothetical protein